jgi:raffinose/stachyose/melibiose transport system permease protein
MYKHKIYPKWFLIIPIILYVVFFLAPGLLGIGYSFTDWNSRSLEINFVGFQNYIEVFTSNRNYSAGIANTLKFTVISNIIKITTAFFLAVMLQKKIKGRNFYRSVLYIPAVLPFLIIGIIFKSILNYNNGLLNIALEALQLGFLKQQWLSDLNVVWKSIYMVDAWRGIGYVMTIFLAGLSSIPDSYYEAADIDGANFFQKLVHVTLPMLTGAITINLIFGITYGLKVFDIIYVLTNGGPGHATEVITTYSYTLYANGKYAIATSLNTILFVLTAIIGVLVVKYMSRLEVCSSNEKESYLYTLKQLVCIILSIIVITPFYMVFVNSLKTKNEAARMNLSLPREWLFSNYLVVIREGNLIQGFFKQLFICFSFRNYRGCYLCNGGICIEP